MVGVVLFPLMDFATVVLREMRYEYWLYIVSGLLLILYLWAEVISHTLSFIGWPISIGHNLLYIVFALVLGIQMHFLNDPQGWFALTSASAAIAWLTVYYDRALIQQRALGAEGPAAFILNAALARQQQLMRLAPVYMLTGLVPLAAIVFLPNIFIEQRGHIFFVLLQIVTSVVAIVRTIRAFGKLTEPIAHRAMEELIEEE